MHNRTTHDGPADHDGPVSHVHDDVDDTDMYRRARRALTIAALAPIAVCAAIALAPAIGGPDPHARLTAAFTVYAVCAPALLLLTLSTNTDPSHRYGMPRRHDDDEI
ncbi:hypothetical protein ACFU0X_10555 [Streptomyces cellulosae]|uniref:Uncharacterized protein n=1 Tax=Streptomyces cellulosae TaxID=1968 RepID=A0ABW6JH41_STRCE